MKQVLLVTDDPNWAIGGIANGLQDSLKTSKEWEVGVIDSKSILRRPLNFAKAARGADLIHWLCTMSFRDWCVTDLRRKSLMTVHHLGLNESWKTDCLQWSSAVVVTDPLTQHLVRKAFPSLRMHLLPTGFDASLHSPAGKQDRRRARDALGLSTSDVTVCTICNAERPSKRAQAIVDAIANVQKDHHFSAVVGGRGWDSIDISDRGVTVKVVPYDKGGHDLQTIYHASDVYLCASTVEGGPLPVAEALGSGLKVISTEVGQVALWLGHISDGGEMIPSDLSTLTERLRDVVERVNSEDDEDERFRIGAEAARAFSYGALVSDWTKCWETEIRQRSETDSIGTKTAVQLALLSAMRRPKLVMMNLLRTALKTVRRRWSWGESNPRPLV